MSQRQEKKKRRMVRTAYNYLLEQWQLREPSKWRFISHWLWKKKKPVRPKGAK